MLYNAPSECTCMGSDTIHTDKAVALSAALTWRGCLLAEVAAVAEMWRRRRVGGTAAVAVDGSWREGGHMPAVAVASRRHRAVVA